MSISNNLPERSFQLCLSSAAIISRRKLATFLLITLTATSLGYDVADAQYPNNKYPNMEKMPQVYNNVDNAKPAVGNTKQNPAKNSLPPSLQNPQKDVYQIPTMDEPVTAPSGADCSFYGRVKGCRDWYSTILANTGCAALISGCAGLTGGPTVGKACLALAGMGGCTWSSSTLMYVLDQLKTCVDWEVSCDETGRSRKPGMCDPRGTIGISAPAYYCSACCKMAVIEEGGLVKEGGGQWPARPSTELKYKYTKCYDLCRQLGMGADQLMDLVGPSCTPKCDGKSCGHDGCGGSCGTCAAGLSCVKGQCAQSASKCTQTCQECQPISAYPLGCWVITAGCGSELQCPGELEPCNNHAQRNTKRVVNCE